MQVIKLKTFILSPERKVVINLFRFAVFILTIGLYSCSSGTTNGDYPDAVNNPGSGLMLSGVWVPENPHKIDFKSLPRILSEHVIISDVHESDGVNQHNYLIYYSGKFWVMWSDGPGVEDRVGQRVAYATSEDGLVSMGLHATSCEGEGLRRILS